MDQTGVTSEEESDIKNPYMKACFHTCLFPMSLPLTLHMISLFIYCVGTHPLLQELLNLQHKRSTVFFIISRVTRL